MFSGYFRVHRGNPRSGTAERFEPATRSSSPERLRLPRTDRSTHLATPTTRPAVALPSSELNPHIETHVREALPVLLKAANCSTQLAKFGSEATTNLLPNTKGEQCSPQVFSGWVQRMWKDLTGKPMNAHKIRSIMVTDLYNRSTTLQTRQAHASSMGQTMGTQ